MPISILVVDDDPELRELLVLQLETGGHQVLKATDGMEAISLLKSQDVDVVVLDMMTPRLSGTDVLELVKEESPGVEVVVVTAYASVDILIRCLRAGAVDVLQKPVPRPDLLAAVARAVDRQRETATRGLFQASQAVFSARQTGNLPEVIARIAGQVMAADDVSLLLPGADGRLYVAHASGMSPKMAAEVCLAVGERIAGRVAADHQPALLSHGLASDPRFAGITSFARVRSSIVYPLVAEDRLVGVLTFNRVSDERAYRRVDLHRAAVFASLALLALENSRLGRQALASERLATLGQLSAGLTHEINNPITYVLASNEHLSSSLEELEGLTALVEQGGPAEAVQAWWTRAGGVKFFEEMRLAVKDAGEGVERIREIIRDVRAVARSDTAEVAPFDLNDSIRSALRLAGAELRSEASLTTDLGPDAIMLGSSGALSQVFINLLVNAAQAIRESERRPCTAAVTSRRDGDRVIAEVRDTGPGIRSSHLARLFEPFFTTRGATTGTGLGLWISGEIVRRHGGEISVESVLGEGTTFRVTFPAATAAGVRCSAQVNGTRAANVARVLFVDDEPAVLRAYQRHFARTHDVTIAEGGEAALAALKTGPGYDAIVCDLLMPDLTGMDVYDRACQVNPSLSQAFLFVTGSIEHVAVQRFIEASQRPILEKPFKMIALEQFFERRGR